MPRNNKEKNEKRAVKPYVEKIDSLEELNKRGLIIIDDLVEIKNNLSKILKKKRISNADLAKLTGISRQNINAVIMNKMTPGINFCLKISYALNVPVDEIFILTEEAWVKPCKQDKDSTLYVDVVRLEILNSKAKNERLRQDGYEYYNCKTREFVTKDIRDALLREYIDNNYDEKVRQIARNNEENLTTNQLNSIAVEELKNEFSEKYIKIYKKLGEKLDKYPLL